MKKKYLWFYYFDLPRSNSQTQKIEGLEERGGVI
jgi:hypothetical protein